MLLESSADGIWYKGIKTQMERMITQRKITEGESFDQSATEIYLPQIRELSAAFARAICDLAIVGAC